MNKFIEQVTQCKSKGKIIVISLVFLFSLAFLLAFFSYKDYRRFLLYQQDIASQSISGAANNITTYMDSLKTSLKIYLDGHQEQLAELLNSPDNGSVHKQVEQQLSQYFRGFYTFTIADDSGQLLFDDFVEKVGGACRKDIHEFALSHDKVDAYIHPGPTLYHFDVMQNWQYKQQNIIFFVSFGLQHISYLLQNAQLPGHRLILLRSDRPGLVEVTAQDTHSRNPEQIYLSQLQDGQLLSSKPVAGTRWLLVDIMEHSLISDHIYNLIYVDLMVFSVFLIILVLMIWHLMQEEKKRYKAEQELKQSHLQLEKNVQARTKDLQHNMRKLQQEVEKNTKLSSAIEQTGDIIVISDKNGIVEYVNPTFEKITGYKHTEVIGTNLKILNSGQQSRDFYQTMWTKLNNGQIFHSIFINRKKDGQLYHEEKTISPIRNRQGKITHFVATGKDITEKVRTEQHIQHLAYHDALTKLPNRLLFQDRLKHAMTQSQRCHTILAILFIDLDKFKIINDSLGHATGDVVLQEISDRLIKTVRESDTIARLGGDEFALVLENNSNINEVITIIKRILNQVKLPVIYGEHQLHTTASIGVTIFPFEDNTMEDLLKQADIAMYHAKNVGGNNFQFYSTSMGETAGRRMRLVSLLRDALERNEFNLHYQPRINLKNGMITGAEALLRWSTPELGNISPDEFIPILEESGHIIEVGRWVFEQACIEFGQQQNNLRLAINLSPRQFSDPFLIQDIENILMNTGYNPLQLDIEVTESLLAEDHEQLLNKLNAFHNKGIKISIDDFGTGYSSLSYLKDLPIDCLKIDRSFVTNLELEPDNIKLISAIVSMAHSLNMTVVTEGIETKAQLEILKQKHSEEGQGFLFSHPLPIDEYLEWSNNYNAHLESDMSHLPEET